MKFYELTYLISPELTTKEAKKVQNKVQDILEELDATLNKSEEPTKRNLAQKVEGEQEAYLATTHIEIDPQKVKLIKEKLKRGENILRHLVVSREEKPSSEETEETSETVAEKEQSQSEETAKAEQPQEIDKEEETEEKEQKKEKDKAEEEDETEEEKEEEDNEEDEEGDDEKVKLNEIDEKIDEII